ncbi:GNAT family N-acetyltransferase [Thermodesulfobacteriota bacterium]
MDNVLIRKLTVEDVENINSIHAAITQAPVVDDFNASVKEHAVMEKGASFVAEIDGKVVGYMVSYILSGGFGISKSAWIAMLGVNPKYMGQGIGDKLAQEILDYYQKVGVKDIYTSVRWDSTDLLSFFKRLGFDRSDFINLRKIMD